METRGPMFDGEAERLAAAMCSEIEQVIAQAGADLVKANLGQVIQHPTGYYESHIGVESDGAGDAVTDRGVVYGPWLEGTGSRNRTTRFKGYATFRRSAQQLEGRAKELADRVAEKYVRRMG